MLPNNFYLCIRRTRHCWLRSGRLYGETILKAVWFSFIEKNQRKHHVRYEKVEYLIGTLILSAGLSLFVEALCVVGHANDDLYALHDKRPSPASSRPLPKPARPRPGAPRRVGGEDRRSAGFGRVRTVIADESGSNPLTTIFWPMRTESAYARRLRLESPTYRTCRRVLQASATAVRSPMPRRTIRLSTTSSFPATRSGSSPNT